MTAAIPDLRAAGFRGALDAERPLGPLTTWRIGGPAELLAQPVDEEDVRHAIAWATRREVPWRVMGNGSNLLVADAGVRGLILRLRKVLDHVERKDATIVVGAGASFPALARMAATAGLSGIEFATGIPGTVGGAVVMNAGWHQYETRNVVESVRVMRGDGGVDVIDAASCGFGYRESVFRRGTDIVVGATLRLEPAEPAEIESRLERFAGSRKENQPTERASCGSVFLKPTADFAGRLIDEAGLKGLRVGSMEVSAKHANFFVNTGGGSSAEALELVSRVESEVFRRFDVRLVREFDYWD